MVFAACYVNVSIFIVLGKNELFKILCISSKTWMFAWFWNFSDVFHEKQILWTWQVMKMISYITYIFCKVWYCINVYWIRFSSLSIRSYFSPSILWHCTWFWWTMSFFGNILNNPTYKSTCCIVLWCLQHVLWMFEYS